MIGILLDQGLPRSAAVFLRNNGWDVLHTGDIGLSRSSDAQILEYAKSENRVIITLDSDFHTILALKNASAPSVIRIRLEGLKGPELAYLIQKLMPRIEPSSRPSRLRGSNSLRTQHRNNFPLSPPASTFKLMSPITGRPGSRFCCTCLTKASPDR